MTLERQQEIMLEVINWLRKFGVDIPDDVTSLQSVTVDDVVLTPATQSFWAVSGEDDNLIPIGPNEMLCFVQNSIKEEGVGIVSYTVVEKEVM